MPYADLQIHILKNGCELRFTRHKLMTCDADVIFPKFKGPKPLDYSGSDGFSRGVDARYSGQHGGAWSYFFRIPLETLDADEMVKAAGGDVGKNNAWGVLTHSPHAWAAGVLRIGGAKRLGADAPFVLGGWDQTALAKYCERVARVVV